MKWKKVAIVVLSVFSSTGALLVSAPPDATAQNPSFACGAGGSAGIGCFLGPGGCWQGAFERDRWGYLYCDPSSPGVTNCCRSDMQE